MTVPRAIVKVVPAGSARQGYLRATLMFSPIDTTNGDELRAWPVTLFKWLQGRGWQVPLRFRSADAPDEKFDPVCATAYAAEAAWDKRPLDPRLAELWREAFRIELNVPTDAARLEAKKSGKRLPCTGVKPELANETAVWRALSQAVSASNNGLALQARAGLKSDSTSAPSPPPAASAASAASAAAGSPSPNAGSPGSPQVEVQSVLPMRQSDLAVLLELQRAWELCETARRIHDDVKANTELWDSCKLRSRAPGGASAPRPKSSVEPASMLALRDQATEQYEANQKASGSCTPVAIQAVDSTTAIGQSADAIAELISDPLDSQQQGNQTGKDNVPSCCTSTKDILDITSQRFFAIQGSPALSRLFGLTIDVEFPACNLSDLLSGEHQASGTDGPATFGYVASRIEPYPKDAAATVSVSEASRSPVEARGVEVWTLFKFVPEDHFWPAARAELGCTVAPSQVDGLFVLGEQLEAKASKPDAKTSEPATVTVPRFGITSLNVKVAAEGELDRRCHVNKDMKMPEGFKDPESCPTPDPQHARKTHPTAGLVLLDRGRQNQAVAQLAARDLHNKDVREKGSITLDADDLTIGYRLDAAVRVHGSAPLAWRTLMARRIEHGASGPFGHFVAAKLPLLLAPPDPSDKARRPSSQAVEWRETIEDAVLGMPIRMSKSDTQTEPGKEVHDTYVEEAIAIWNGEPMGAHCAGDRALKTTAMDVGVGDTIRLPDSHSETDRRLPPLRFGWPYRLGMRVVYAGAISVPLSKALRAYNQTPAHPTAALTLPPSAVGDPLRMRRFLRHERVDAPYLLLPDEIAMTRNGPMGYERAAHAIVRSSHGVVDADRGLPAATRRIFVVPNTDVHFTAYHGVFDHLGSRKPPQGLEGICFDAPQGGFPFVTSRIIKGIDGEPFEADREITKDISKHGDLVFMPSAANPDKRPVPYYPDPHATFFAIGVRYAGTKVYLAGGPCLLPIYSAQRGYPHARPLVLDIVRDASRSRDKLRPTLEQVLHFPPAKPSSTADAAPKATLMLAAGDDFEVDVWCIPDWQGLANRSAVIEAICVIAAEKMKGRDTIQAKCQALADLFPWPVCEAFERNAQECDRGFDAPGNSSWRAALDGTIGPSNDLLRVVALSIHETLVKRPLREIAAVRTIRATHATNQPRVAPSFFGDDSRFARPVDVQPLCLRREPALRAQAPAASQPASGVSSPATAAMAASAPASAPPPVVSAPPVPSRDVAVAPPAPIEYSLSGDLLVDIATTSGVEIRARTTFPTSNVFDDPNRGRSTRQRRDGTWPEISGRALKTRDVFGFCVDVDGSVDLPTSEVILLRVDDLMPPIGCDQPPGPDGTVKLSLDDLSMPDAPAALGRIKSRHVFPDRKARLLELTVLARPRHEMFMRTANAPARDGRWLRPGKDLAEPLERPDALKVCAWLPAGTRPSEPVCRSPIPAFVWNQARDSALPGSACRRVSRRSVVRIPMGRGWYSSGAGELLGVVVWPPSLFRMSEWRLAENEVPAASTDERTLMKLPNFEDDDLGPGGRFVTRWGDDPIRPQAIEKGASPGGTFIPPSAFVDLDPSTRIGFEAEKVEMVDMPIHIGNPPPAGSANAGTSTRTTGDDGPVDVWLKVSLVVYKPRFDIESEQWYVDMAVEHPDEAEPFLRLGLVRYQPHAAPELRVSYPVTQWTQLAPPRSVEVSVQSRALARRVFATISGLRPAMQAAPPVAADASAEAPAEHQMKVAVMRNYFNEIGLRCQEVKCRQDVAPLDASGYGGPRSATTWQFDSEEFPVDPVEDRLQRASYFVYVEERELRLPATYADEPVRPEALTKVQAAQKIPSGPKFTARIDL